MVKTDRLNHANPFVTSCDIVTARDIKRIKTNLRRRFERKTLDEILKDYPDIARGTLHRFITSDYVPQDTATLESLGVRVLPKLPMDILRIIRGGV